MLYMIFINMNLRRIIKEEVDDFDWAKGDIYFGINEIIGKKLAWRENNLDELLESGASQDDLTKYDIKFGGIRWDKDKMWVVESILPDGDVSIKVRGGDVTYSIKEVESYVNLGVWVLFGENGNILNDFSNKNLNEEQDDFDWIRDSEPSEIIDLGDLSHVDSIQVGDKLEITGEADGISFYNEPCEVICVGACSSRRVFLSSTSQVLVTFNREFYSDEMEEETHCGSGTSSISEKCACREAFNEYQDSRLVGTCWWVSLPDMDEVVRVHVADLKESENILDSLFNSFYILTEEGKTEPDMEWDFTKKEIDRSKGWVKTKKDVKKYLTILFDKIKIVPKKIKLKILKYVLMSFVGILTISELTNIVNDVSDEKITINTPKEQPQKIIKQEPVKKIEIRQPSDSLIEFLKQEEGYSDVGYKIGDGKITIGWGHAENIDSSKYEEGQKISKQESEKLLRQDVKESSDALNRILNSWGESGINVDINQDMYDAMTSMIYNMGNQNFRMSDFIQMVKVGDMESAKEEIKKTSSAMFNKFPGLKKRREKESKMFNIT